MTTIVTRSDKGSMLTWAEMDANLTNLNNDKLEVGSPASSIAITPVGELTSTNVQDALSELDSEVTNKVVQTSTTGAAVIPTGSTAQRPSTPIEGHFRRNSELGQWEGYDGAQWEDVGGVSLTAEQTLSNKTLVTPNIYTSFNYTGESGVIKVDGTTRVTIGSQGIKAGSFAPGSIGDADLSLSANSSQVKAALNATGGAPIFACRAWVNFNGTGTVAIRASGNVSSITDNGTGDYTVNFTTAMPDANYASCWMTSAYQDNGTNLYVVSYKNSGTTASAPLTKTTSAARVIVGQGYGATFHDVPDISILFFR